MAVGEASRPPAYPAQWEADVVATDGGTVHVRPIVPGDADAIVALHGRLSDETIYYRFFSPLPRLSDRMLDRLVRVDYHHRFALVAELGDQIIAVALYERLPDRRPGHQVEAEVAFLVDDAHQGRGLGTILLEHLAEAAQEDGITRFVADTLPQNDRMLRVFHEAGFADENTYRDGVVRVVFPIAPTPRSTETRHGREQHATAASMRRLLFPRTVAVIGASRHHPSFGYALLRRLLDGGFRGAVYPVHPDADHLASVRAWPSVVDVPDRIDLAVVVTPAATVPDVVADCVRARVGGLVVVSTGFAEEDAAGADAEREIVAEARRNGMRVIGPGSMGIVNTDPDVRLNATLSPMPPSGSLAFAAQSGGLGVVVLDEVTRRGLGISSFVAAGNKADVSSNDLLQYWDDDPATTIIGMYIESFGNPRVFSRAARRVSRRKPIVAVAAARARAAGSGEPARAAGSGEPARAAGSGETASSRPGVQRPVTHQPGTAVEALFVQSGVIRTDTLEELLDVAQVLASQPLPAGRRVAIVGNAGGPTIFAADACADAGLELAPLSVPTLAALGPLTLPGAPDGAGPVTLSAGAPPGDVGAAVRAVLADDSVDACLAICSLPMPAMADAVADELVGASAAHPDTPLLACVIGRRGLLAGTVPSFAFPEPAVRALERIASYAGWLRRPEGTVAALGGLDADAARAIVDARLAAEPAGAWLSGPDTVAVLGSFGLRVPPTRWSPTPSAAAAAASDIGFPVVVKPDNGPTGPHARRSEVHLALDSPATVRAAAEELGRPVIVQAMAEAEVDVVAGLVQDPVFGPLVTLGPPRVLGESKPPAAARTLPLTDVDTAELIDATLGSAGGLQGQPALGSGGRRGISDVLARLGQLAEELPDVADVELDPILVSDERAAITDARIRVARFVPHPELALRRLG